MKIKMSTMIKATWMLYGVAYASGKISEKKGSLKAARIGVAAAVGGIAVSIATEVLIVMDKIEYDCY